AGIPPGSLARTEVAIRGREEAMIVRTVTDPTVLARLVEAENAQAQQVQASQARYPAAIPTVWPAQGLHPQGQVEVRDGRADRFARWVGYARGQRRPAPFVGVSGPLSHGNRRR